MKGTVYRMNMCILLVACVVCSSLTLPASITSGIWARESARDPSLVAEWRFEEGSGTAAQDASGNGNNGILSNGPAWTAGVIGNGLAFDGTDDYVGVADSSSLRITGALTIEVWWNGTLASTNDWPMWVSKGGYDVANGYEMGFSSNSHVEPGKISLNTGHSDLYTSGGILKPNEWQHIVGTINGSSAKIYRNGIEILNGTLNQLATNNRELSIGRRDPSNNFAGYVTGRMDEVRIYNRALSADEVMTRFKDTERPDLAVTQSDISVSPPSPVVCGIPFNATARISNKGDAAVTSSSVLFFDGDPTSGGIQMGPALEIYNIATGAAKNVSLSWTPAKLGSISLYVKICGTVPVEWNITNNIAHVEVVVVAQSRLVAEWLFDDGSGTVAHDTSGNGNDGILSNGPSWTAGIIGTALNLDGTNDYVAVADSSSIRLTGALTIELWWCGTFASAQDWPMWVSKGGFDLGSGYEMGFTSTTTGNPGVICINTGNSDVTSPAGTLKENRWQHIVGVINGTNGKIFRNGVEVANDTLNPLSTNSRGLNIGRRDTGNMHAGYATGRIDQVRIYDRALSASEIKSRFDAYAKPDIVLTHSDLSISPPSPVLNGAPFNVTARISNRGPATANSASVKFFNGNPASGGIQMGSTIEISDIAEGAIKTATLIWTPVQIGTISIFAEVSGTVPAESDNTNNKASIVAVVVPQSGLVAEWLFDEGNGNLAHDTSGNGNDGTLKSAVWFSETGRDGLRFDGNDDYVLVPGSLSLMLAGNISIEAWFCFEQGGSHNPRVLHKQRSYQLWTDTTDISRKLSFGLTNQSPNPPWSYTEWDLDSNKTLQESIWYHVVGTYDNHTAKIYINGELDAEQVRINALQSSDESLRIGNNNNDLDDFKGRIDLVRIYSRPLTAAEIKAKYEVVAKPDLVLTPSDISVSPASPVVNGTAFTVTAKIKNGGSTSATSASVTFYDGAPASGGLQMGTVREISNIAPGDTKDVILSWRAGKIGTMHIFIEICGTVPAEENTANNKASVDVVVVTPLGLVAEWHLDEGSDTVAHDTSGNDNDGILKNGPSWTSGINGTALSFDGTNDYIAVADSPSLGLTGALSIEVWWYGTLASAQDWPMWVSKGGWDIGSGYEMGYTSTTTNNQGVIAINTGRSGPGSIKGTLKENEWQHIVGTINGTNGKLYLNGKEVADGSLNPLSVNSNDLSIGRRDPGNPHAGYVTGRIDEVRIYNRALGIDEIKARFAAFGSADLSMIKSDMAISPSDTVTNGTQVLITANVKNLGPSTLASASVRFYIGDPATGGVQIGADQTVANIDANSNKLASISWIPEAAGTYQIYVDINGVSPVDTNLSNNKASVTVIVLSKPDLAVTPAELTLSATKITEGGMVNITATIRNSGQSDAYSVAVRFLDGAIQIGADVVIPSVKGNGGSAQASMTWKASPKGTHTITVRVDPNDHVNESNEANNIANQSISVKSRQIQVKSPGFEFASGAIAISISWSLLYIRRRKSRI